VSWPILSRQPRQRNPLSQTFHTVCKIIAQCKKRQPHKAKVQFLTPCAI
jgi:hypothetical protein